MTGYVGALALCSLLLNSTKESKYGLKNVDFCTLVAIVSETVQATH